jgi:coatomer protein complex subunit alpha (xenin)
VVNFKPLKKFFLASYAGSRSFLRANAAVDPLAVPLFRSVEDIKAKGEKFVLPNRATSLAKLVEQLQEAYSTTTLGKFADALVIFKTVLQSIVMVVVSEESEISEVGFILIDL